MLHLASKLMAFSISTSSKIVDFIVDKDWDISYVIIKKDKSSAYFNMIRSEFIEKIDRSNSYMEIDNKNVEECLDREKFLKVKDNIVGSSVKGKNEILGQVHDILVDDIAWNVKYIIVELEDELRLISPDQIEVIEKEQEQINTDLTKEDLYSFPRFDPTKKLDSKDNEVLYLNYGKVIY